MLGEKQIQMKPEPVGFVGFDLVNRVSCPSAFRPIEDERLFSNCRRYMRVEKRQSQKF